MNRFFHLPSLYVYLLAVVLLVTSLFYAGALLRDGLYLLMGLDEQYPNLGYSGNIQLTPDAEAYVKELQAERSRALNIANFLKRGITLVLAAGSFLFFWRRANPFGSKEMAFTMPNFYFFLVSSIAFIIFFFALANTVNNVVDTAIVGDRGRYVNIDALYLKYDKPVEPNAQPIKVELDDLKKRLADYDKQTGEYDWRRGRTRSIIDSLSISLVALPVFLFHDRRFTRKEA